MTDNEGQSDGVLKYAEHLSQGRDVVAVAVSGDPAVDVRISTFKQHKGGAYQILADSNGHIERLCDVNEYHRAFLYDPKAVALEEEELRKFARNLNNFLWQKVKLEEGERPLLVAACLIALWNDLSFARSYEYKSAELLPGTLLDTVEGALVTASIPDSKRALMKQAFSFIGVSPILRELMEGDSQSVLQSILKQLTEHVIPLVDNGSHLDILGHFYEEFLRYADGGKKTLGIVLTPPHITALFSDIAAVSPDDTVIDTCTGTGGFLISAMNRMVDLAHGDEVKIAEVKSRRLIGVEAVPHMFTLACSNMILRGDGKSNLYFGNSLSREFSDKLAHSALHDQPTVGLINPPYDQGTGKSELDFTEKLLNMLSKNGTVVVIAPLSMGTPTNSAEKAIKRRILAKHTLEAVMRVNKDLFAPYAGVGTAIFVFTAHVPHPHDKETWFADWQDDGFVKRKGKTRADSHHRWNDIRRSWIRAYRNRSIIPMFSASGHVTADDEWAVGDQLLPDVSTLTVEMFAQSLRNFTAHKIRHDLPILGTLTKSPLSISARLLPDPSTWKSFRLDDLFDIRPGKAGDKHKQVEGRTPFIGAKNNSNGVVGLFLGSEHVHDPGCLTVASQGDGGVGFTFYQEDEFIAGSTVTVCRPRTDLEPLTLLFVAQVIQLERFRYSHGRGFNQTRMKATEIRLPARHRSQSEDGTVGNVDPLEAGLFTPDWETISEFMSSLEYSAVPAQHLPTATKSWLDEVAEPELDTLIDLTTLDIPECDSTISPNSQGSLLRHS